MISSIIAYPFRLFTYYLWQGNLDISFFRMIFNRFCFWLPSSAINYLLNIPKVSQNTSDLSVFLIKVFAYPTLYLLYKKISTGKPLLSIISEIYQKDGIFGFLHSGIYDLIFQTLKNIKNWIRERFHQKKYFMGFYSMCQFPLYYFLEFQCEKAAQYSDSRTPKSAFSCYLAVYLIEHYKDYIA